VEISSSLTEVFRAHVRPGLALPEPPGELERLLSQRFEEAKAPWPGVELPAADLVRHLAERLPEAGEGAEVGALLDGLRLSDLYLACACVKRVPGADAALEREYLGKLPGILRRQFRSAPSAEIEDVCQRVRVKLLLGDPPGHPHLLTYTGEGALLSWIRIIGVRALIKAPPADRPDALAPEPLADLDVEGDAIKGELHQKFREVVQEAVRTLLSQDDRYLLKLHYKDGKSTLVLARYFGVSQPTLWRRLDRIREKILAESKRLMRERYGIEGEGLRSLVSGLESRFDITLSRLFDSDAPPG
jgi:RNA polymerase sigma-70 factor, ECF subfamily